MKKYIGKLILDIEAIDDMEAREKIRHISKSIDNIKKMTLSELIEGQKPKSVRMK